MARAEEFAGRVVTFGASDAATVSARAIEHLGIEGMRARVSTPAGERILIPACSASGNLQNVLAASAAALEMGVALDAVVAAAGRLKSADRRGAVHRLRGGIVLIDDSYNSSPSALRQCARRGCQRNSRLTQGRCPGRDAGARRSGSCTARGIGALRRRAGLRLLVTIGGEGARRLADAAISPPECRRLQCTYFERSELAATEVAGVIRSGDLVLVKGSRGTRTDHRGRSHRGGVQLMLYDLLPPLELVLRRA